MAKLLLKHEGVTLNTFELTKETTFIGRKTNNDIQLNDAIASSQHARITIKPNQYLEGQVDVFIEDLGSTNGTQVNDQLVNSAMLKNGDTIQIGNHFFYFDSEQSATMDETAIYLPDDA